MTEWKVSGTKNGFTRRLPIGKVRSHNGKLYMKFEYMKVEFKKYSVGEYVARMEQLIAEAKATIEMVKQVTQPTEEEQAAAIVAEGTSAGTQPEEAIEEDEEVNDCEVE